MAEEPVVQTGVLEVPTTEQATAGSMAISRAGEVEQDIAAQSWRDKLRALTQVFNYDSAIGSALVESDKELAAGALTRYVGRWQMERQYEREGRAKISADEANKKWPTDKPYTEDVYPEIAQLNYYDKKELDKYRTYVERGGGSGFFLSLLAGAPTMADPLNLLATVATGGLARGLALRGSLGAAAQSAAQLGKDLPLRIQLAENIAGNVAVDIPTAATLTMGEKRDVNIGETLVGSIGGGIAGTGLNMALRGAYRKIKGMAGNLPDGVVKRSIYENVAALFTNRKPRASIGINEQIRAASGVKTALPEGVPVTPVDETRVFVAKDSLERPLNGTAPADIGEGVHVVTSRDVAENLSLDPENAIKSKVDEMVIREPLKYLDGDARVKDLPGLAESLEVGGKQKFFHPEEMNVRELVDTVDFLRESGAIPKETLGKVYNYIKSQGFDGIRYQHAYNGQPVHSTLHVFDPSKLEKVSEFSPDHRTLPRSSPSELKNTSDSLFSENNRMFSNANHQKEVKLLDEEAVKYLSGADEVVAGIEQHSDRILKNDPELAEIPSVQDRVEGIAEMVKEQKDSGAAYKVIADCITRFM